LLYSLFLFIHGMNLEGNERDRYLLLPSNLKSNSLVVVS